MKMSEGVRARAEEWRIQMHGRRETEITPDRRARGVQLNFSGISSLSWHEASGIVVLSCKDESLNLVPMSVHLSVCTQKWAGSLLGRSGQWARNRGIRGMLARPAGCSNRRRGQQWTVSGW